VTEAAGYGAGPVPPGAFRPLESPRGRYTLSDYAPRAAAAIIDMLVVGAIAVAFLFVAGVSVGGSGAGAVIGGYFLAVVLLLVVTLLYAPVLLVRWDGQTLGKRAMGVRVIRVDGSRIDFGWAVLREVILKNFVLWIVTILTFSIVWFLNYLWPLWDSEHRAGYEFLCGSRVVKATKAS
jgi:uncharacterized RDD family membrane protein YckC